MKRVFLFLCILCYLTGIVIFLKGFFPIKAAVTGYSKWQDYNLEPIVEGSVQEGNPSERLPPVFRKFVFILIDALRADFVLPTPDSNLPKMQFVNMKIIANESHSFLAKAHPPTVTLPRVKAMTSGSIPGFVDVVLNFDSKSFTEDNIITQMKRAGKRMVFYGDDTWMRLFPDHFIRTDGTTSFFVTDYTQVDDNVTRHLENEFSSDDWDVLILHYLGLDHIGHLSGPRSPLVKPKLTEMDHIVKTIYDKLSKEDAMLGQPSLMLICGDHGMSDQGSHGGSSASETAVPIVFISSAWERNKGSTYNDIQRYQIDLAPTLSLSIGVPVPQNNLGTILLPVMQDLPPRERLQRVHVNAAQIANIYKQYDSKYNKAPMYQMYQRALKRHKHWLKVFNDSAKTSNIDMKEISEKTIDLYMKSMVDMRSKIASSLSSYDMHAIGVGVIVIWLTTLIVLLLHNSNSSQSVTMEKFLLSPSLTLAAMAVYFGVHINICTSTSRSDLLCTLEIHSVVLNMVVCVTLGLFVNTVLRNIWKNGSKNEKSHKERSNCKILKWILRAGMVGHALSLLASSLIEEEHQTWYFLTFTFIFAVGVIYIKRYVTANKELTLINERNYTINKLCDDKRKKSQDQNQKVQTIMKQYQTPSEVTIRTGDINSSQKAEFETEDNKENDVENKKKHIQVLKSEYLISTISVLILLVLCRIMKSWNSTGDKWAHLPDVGDWLVSPENKIVLSALSAMCLLLSAIIKAFTAGLHWRQHALYSAGIIYVYMFRSATGDLYLPYVYDVSTKTKGISEARTIYFIIILMFINTAIQTAKTYNSAWTKALHFNYRIQIEEVHETKPLKYKRNRTYVLAHVLKTYMLNIQTMWMLLMLLLVRPHNISLVLMEVLQVLLLRNILVKIKMDVVSITFLYIWMANASFFYQGNSNSITTVDVSAGYIGLDTFQPVLVGLLLALATYAGPILWLISLLLKLSEEIVTQIEDGSYVHKDRLVDDLTSVVTAVHLSDCIPVAVYVVLVTLQRYHLFVWTVFSPKLLYEGMHSLVISVFTMKLLIVVSIIDKVNVKLL